ncbi:PEP-CTERM sorting domain-containing protein [Okeania sp.]|uniref:PEP-CTERM sorting domain-containing protein n=1 Tax=Okeania sp. TaxID=3100323 RepID=UPI002B4ADA54|nr:PEP-CTERM sorting domain-containing protein [Okeania sp.]MEB3339352.1 PEP-CTERM sorting domain-containing protein [Okeania sp.]
MDLGLGLDLKPTVNFDFYSTSDWGLLVDFGIAFDAPEYTLKRDASDITFTGSLGLAGGYIYQDDEPTITITQTQTSFPEPGTIFGLLAVGGLGLVVKLKE